MTCANCGYGTDELYRCDTCGDEVCEGCIVQEGDTIDDIRMTCLECVDERR